METLEGKMAQVEATGHTFIGGYAIPEAWVDLVSDELPAANVMALVVSYGGHIRSEIMDVPAEARRTYDTQVVHEAEYGQTAWALEDARHLATRNALLREQGREIPFDEHFKWPTPIQAA